MLNSSVSVPAQPTFPIPGWPASVRVAFRFAFLYWAIYMLPSPGSVSLLDLVPWLGEKASAVLGWPMHRLESALTGVWIPRWERWPLRIGAHLLQGLVVVSALYSVVWSSYRETRTVGVQDPCRGSTL